MRRPALGFAAAAAAVAAAPVLAHDFWLQPQRFWVQPGAALPMVLLVGHGAARQRSDIAASRFTLFRSIGPDGMRNRAGELTLGKPADASPRFAAAGTHVVFFATSNVASELPAKRFNEYAAAEGLDMVIAGRRASGALGRPGRELYSRRGKAIVQVGAPGSAMQPHVTKPVGLGLEIVPLTNPYAGTGATRMTVQVLYQGKPLPGALIKLNNLAADAQPVEMHRSDGAGRAVFRLQRSGRWQYNVVWSQPLANNSSADFLTTFSSLTYGFPDARPLR